MASAAVAYYASLASDWERRYQKTAFRSREAVLSKCLRERELAGSTWLDVGCGTGTLARWLAARGCRVFAVDAAPQMLAAAAQFAYSSGFCNHLRFAKIDDVARLPSPDNSSDGVLCSSVLEYVLDPCTCLKEFFRVLKPGGLLLVSVPNRNSIVRRAQVACHRMASLVGTECMKFMAYSRQQFSVSEFECLLRQTGFSLQKMLPLGSPFPALAQRSCLWGPLLMFVAQKV
jgi:ubiquinone/menaquinone biosynthesis C-methylase UbiE